MAVVRRLFSKQLTQRIRIGASDAGKLGGVRQDAAIFRGRIATSGVRIEYHSALPTQVLLPHLETLLWNQISGESIRKFDRGKLVR